MHITGTYVVGPQIKCEGCGKLSGLDDFVKGALKHGIHDTKFMINALKTSRENRTPAHKLACCVCHKTFLERNSASERGDWEWHYLLLDFCSRADPRDAQLAKAEVAAQE
ncbi:hypothetical protein FRB96_006963 [Tulasnella sp. 330]|nr:hypothetical protein FRB96_006963 [Tulasnella sp. 330]